MRRWTRRGLSVVGLIALCGGCSAPLRGVEAALEQAGLARFDLRPTGDLAAAVEVRASLDPGALAGRGAVVSGRHVVTVEHVLQGHDRVFVATAGDRGWVGARVVRRERAAPEPLVVLELDVDEGAYGLLLGFEGFAPERVLVRGRGAPATVLTARGRLPWGPDVLARGDSGSPVLDAAGGLVGVVSGRREGDGVYVALGASSLPDPTRVASTR